MGSFANSVHVQSDDAEKVATIIRELLPAEGWSPTEEQPDDETVALGLPASHRAIRISQPVNGWVSILDSDMIEGNALAADLADRLDTYAFYFLVNDSDSWYYALFLGPELVDEFDSSAEDGEPVQASDADMAQFLESLGSFQQMMQDGSLESQLEQMQQQVTVDPPPELQGIEDRMQQGTATPEEMQRYQAWFAAQFPEVQQQIDQMLGNLFKIPESSAKPKRSKGKSATARKAAAKKRLAILGRLLDGSVAGDQVLDVLDARSTFAEMDLGQFLPLVGIPSYYAYLSYAYLADATSEQLTSHAIRFGEPLLFKSNVPHES